nr:MAG: zinc-binding loop region of homing endonuclease [Bacteriophage sp.]
MIHKQYNEIMANSKKKFSNLYSAIDQGRSKILRTKWKPNVPGNKYYVSRNGIVYRNLGNGYWLRISVYSDGKPDGYLKCKINMKSWLLHRLVATVYLPNPDGLPIVMHLNNNKQDCRVKNLKWGTDLENTLQAWFDGCLPTPNKIIYFNDVHHLHNQGLSNLEIANILPIHVSSVKRILNGKGLIKYKDKFKNYEQ